MAKNSPVLVVNINWRNLDKKGRFAEHNPLYPLDLMYISDYMDKVGIENELIDLWGENKSLKDIINKIKASEIIVTSSAPSYNFWRDGTVDAVLPISEIDRIKEINPKIKVVLVGPHASAIPTTFDSSKADYVVCGEPDIVASDVVKRLQMGKKVDFDYVTHKGKKGWSYSTNNANVEDLTELPIMNFKKLSIDNYTWPKPPHHIKAKRVAAYEASRGCIYNCTFCFRAGFRGKFRLKSIKTIAKELDQLKELNVDYIYFIDEIFSVDDDWTEQVCSELKKRGLTWGYESRPEYQTKEKTKMAYDSGCRIIHLGLESANNDVQTAIGKATIELNKLKKDIDYMVKLGIYVKIYLITGSPKETRDTIRETLNFVTQFPLDKVTALTNVMMPYPGTILWKQGQKMGFPLKNWEDVLNYSGIIGNSFKTPQEVKKEVAKFNATIVGEQMKLRKKKELKKRWKSNPYKIAKFSAAQAGCSVLQVMPGLFDTFYKFYRFI